MAIFSLHHKSIGRSTHRRGRTGAHVRYVSRRSAEPEILAARMPSEWKQAKRWFDQEESEDRKNARIADSIMVALPRELSPKQRSYLVKAFLEDLTEGLVPWYAAIHAKGEDEDNPHAHILIRDRSPSDGRRVLKLSSRGSTIKIRRKWSQWASMALRAASYDLTVDHRSLKDQGIDRLPTKHRGPSWKGQRKPLQKRVCFVPN